MSKSEWNAIAQWRDFRMGDRGDLWHRGIIDPTLELVVGRVRGLRVLDLACGNGYLARRWDRAGASTVVAVDGSATSIRYAQRRDRRAPTDVRYLVRDTAHLTGLADGSFDLVVANMALMDIEDLAGTLREVARVLGPRGRFIFAICHPCFDVDFDSKWVVEQPIYERHVWRATRRYRMEGTRKVPWQITEEKRLYTTTFHRMLSTYARELRRAGFAILRLEEPLPSAEVERVSDQGHYIREIPLHLIVEAVHWRMPLSRDLPRPRRRRGANSR
jgi:ubiquinone/menaquinone biosynthesis C-methylase UbiE